MAATPGATATVDLVVDDADTAAALGSGDVAVLGTPRVLAMAEEACCLAVEGGLGPQSTTVGMRVQLDHLAPIKVGTKVRAEATLDKVEGRRLVFTVTVSDECGLVAAGRLTRVVVERAEFLDKAR